MAIESATPIADRSPRRRTPPALKRLLNSEGLRGLACWLAAQYIRFVWLTGRWQVIRGEIPQRYWDGNQAFILAFWHNRLLMMPFCWPKSKKMNMLISQHRDGEIIARTIAHFGLGAVRGSAGNADKGGDKTKKGGAQALRAMARAAEAGESLGITPDGPRGPRMRASDGVAALARLTGLPVIPATYSIRRRIVLGTWDRFIIALPFSRGHIVWGEPIAIPRRADEDAMAAAVAAIEASLTRISLEADALAGVTPIAPAETKS